MTALAVYDDGQGPALYAGGAFLTAGAVVANGIAKWDGVAWTELRGPSGVGVRFGDVLALAVYDDGGGPALFAAGTFNLAGNVTTTGIAKWDGHAWSALIGPSGEGVGINGGGRVSALAVYDDGTGAKLYVGGAFGTAGGIPTTNLAAWNGQVWSAAGTGAAIGNKVDALAVYDDGGGPALFVGGHFQLAGGITVNNVARWDGSGWSALSGPSGTGVESIATVDALAVYDDGGGPALFATGSFATAGGVTANRVARWRNGTWAALSGPSGTGIDGTGLSLAVYDDGGGPGLYLGGDFTTAGGVTTDRIARWRGGAWAPLTGPAGSGTSGAVRSLATFDDGGGTALFVGGDFLRAGGRVSAAVARWDGVLWTALAGANANGVSSSVLALAVYDDGGGPDLYAGGTFLSAGDVEVNRIARWDGSTWSTLTGPAGEGVVGGLLPAVQALAVYDDGGGPALYAGGDFLTAGGVTVNGIAKWDGSGWSALSGPAGSGVSGEDGEVFELAVYDDGGGPALYAAGDFLTAGGVTVNYVAKWDGTAWSALAGPSGFGTNGRVLSLTVYDDGSGPALYLGGDFVSAGGVTVNHVARWNGLAWTDLTGPSGTGTDFALHGLGAYSGGGESNLYAAGSFLHAGGLQARYFAKWDGQAWSAVPGFTGTPIAFAVEGDGDGATLVVGGFGNTTAGGMQANGMARWNGSQWSVFSGPAGTGVSGSTSVAVVDLAVYDAGDGGALYAGGSFLGAGGIPSRNIARWSCVPPIFADGFESGDVSAWSGAVGVP